MARKKIASIKKSMARAEALASGRVVCRVKMVGGAESEERER
jgi:hypothetical protein